MGSRMAWVVGGGGGGGGGESLSRSWASVDARVRRPQGPARALGQGC